jgi:FAD/FMN-containing dehydrogenase
MRATTLTSAVHPTISIPSLRRGFAGQVIDPGDDGYDRARTVFFGGHDQRPAVIVRPTGATGVAQVVDLARETGLELAVRSGGHSTAGHSTTSGGILLDLSAMKALDIDPAGASRGRRPA